MCEKSRWHLEGEQQLSFQIFCLKLNMEWKKLSWAPRKYFSLTVASVNLDKPWLCIGILVLVIYVLSSSSLGMVDTECDMTDGSLQDGGFHWLDLVDHGSLRRQ